MDRPSVEVTEATLGSTEVRAGETPRAEATVKNADGVRRAPTVRLAVGDDALVGRTVAVPTDATRSQHFWSHGRD